MRAGSIRSLQERVRVISEMQQTKTAKDDLSRSGGEELAKIRFKTSEQRCG